MQEALYRCRLYARLGRPVVFTGPFGAGKSWLARYVHELSPRRDRPFVDVPAGELANPLCLDRLFGHTLYAFTDAKRSRPGAFQRAAGGTLLLDDLALLTGEVQAALLRPLAEQLYTPTGSDRDVPVTCRLMFGTTVSPGRLVETGRLLRDLESRLGEFVINVPGLAARPEEILPLAQLFVEITVRSEALGGTVPNVSPAAARALRRHDWPGNVRELSNVMVHATVHAVGARSDSIELDHLPERFRREEPPRRGRPRKLSPEVVMGVLEGAHGVQSEAARRLGVHRHSIRNLLQR